MASFRKSILSQYLRTKCDRQLRLGMMESRELEAIDWPVPLKARPAVQILRDRGFEWEDAKLGDLESALPQNLVAKKEGNEFVTVDLTVALRAGVTPPAVILQGKFGDERLQPAFLASLGLAPEVARIIPPFVAFNPDILLVQAAGAATAQVLPTGKLAPVLAGDTRKALAICDIKHAGEANSSYSAEIALYAVLLANWLALEGLTGEYFVSARMGLWTRAKENSSIAALVAEQPGAPVLARVEAFLRDWEEVDFEIFFQTVEHFFRVDLPRVLAIDDWRGLDWHVDGRCSNCDFLGYVPWLNTEDKERLARNREHYCVPAAQDCGHLSRVATLTRGSRKTLEEDGHANVAAVAALTRDHGVFNQHNALRADRVHLPHRAAALVRRDMSLSEGTVTMDFPRYADLEIFISVNFDPGTGLLTALGSEARFKQRAPFGTPNDVRRVWPAEAQVLLNSNDEEERNALISFLSRLADMFGHVNDPAVDRGGPQAARTRCHLYFWDDRQLEELKRAIGRHLNAIIATNNNNDRYLRGLVWLFPPEQVVVNEGMVLAHPISIMKRVIERDLRLPVPHAHTLFNVAECYHGDYTPQIPGAYYRDPYSDMIPRERIYEIWSQEPLVETGRIQRTRAQCITEYSEAVKKQVGALRGIAWKFCADMRDRLVRDARSLPVRVPFNFQNMSEDGRLWLAWVKLEEACGSLEIRRNFLAEPEALEASYDILRCTGLIEETGRVATFAVDPGSRDCKFRDGESFLTLRIESQPGLLNVTAAEAGSVHPSLADVYVRMSEALGARLVSFDRENLRAVVEFETYHAATRAELINCGVVDLRGPVSLVKRVGVLFSERVARCVQALGRPAIAGAAVETYAALGHAPGTNAPRNDPVTPAAEVLWNGAAIAVEDTGITPDLATAALAVIGANWPVNDSQAGAIRHCLSHRLSVIWGPPGTGKTTTAAAYAVARILVARATGTPVRLLITGPTYTAFEKLFGEVCDLLARLNIRDLASYRVYSGSKAGEHPALPNNYLCQDVETNHSVAFDELAAKLAAREESVLVGTVVHQCYRIAHVATGLAAAEYFDVAVLDESSQIDVSSALYSLSLLAAGFELAMFGDHLQMPPVVLTQPPKGAEWLVGSIQSYVLHRHQLDKIPLLLNYRSSRAFVDFARRIGYPGELAAHSPELALQLRVPLMAAPAGWRGAPWFAGLGEILRPDRALTAVTYADGRAGQANEFEADLVCATVQQLFHSFSAGLAGRRDAAGAVIAVEPRAFSVEEFWQEGVGIVTPHRAQRAVIVRKLCGIFSDHPRALIDACVDTVERFQGGERNTIIIAFGVGDPDLIATEEEFLLKLERTNVAISRARAKCILFISDELAYHLPADRETIATAKAVKCYVNTCCQPRVALAVPTADGGARQVWVRD